MSLAARTIEPRPAHVAADAACAERIELLETVNASLRRTVARLQAEIAVTRQLGKALFQFRHRHQQHAGHIEGHLRHFGDFAHVDEQGVPAGYRKAEKRRLKLRVCKIVCRDVPSYMVHGYKRLIERKRA